MNIKTINRMYFPCLIRIIVLLLISFLVNVDMGKTQNADEKLNIILILTDQQRFDTISKLGYDFMETPNLDRLIDSGTAFTHAFVSSPVCVTARWSLHSGTYSTTHQAYTNHHEGIIPETSLPYELKKNGYTNALIGKNHSFLDSVDFDFQYIAYGYPRHEVQKRMIETPQPGGLEGNPMYSKTNEAIKFISETTLESNPFFIWLSYHHPHDPFAVQEPYFSMYENAGIPEPVVEPEGLEEAGKPFRQIFHRENNDRIMPFDDEQTMLMRQIYYGMISIVDHEIGRLLDFLEDEGLRENTIIIFTSDHGDYMGDHHLITKSPSMYDVLVRVPLIFSWPGYIQKNKISNELISQVDIMPTLLSFADFPIPSQVQGKNLEPYLRGEFDSGKIREVVFAEYGIPGPSFNRYRLEKLLPDYKENPVNWAEGIPWEGNPISMAGRFRMARTLDWKYVQYQGRDGELYDLKQDPNELHNLYNNPEYKEVQYYLKSQLDEWKKSLPGIERDKEDLATPFFEEYLKN